MKVLVVGAAGKTGQLVVQEALAKGHDVTAFVRDPAKLTITHERLRVVQGDALNAGSLEAALAGQEAAMHVAGPPHIKASTVRTDTMRALVGAMQKTGVKRLIALSGMGAGESRDALPFVVRFIVAKLILGKLLADQTGLEEQVKNSALTWTIARPGELKDVPKIGRVNARVDAKRISMGLPRGDVAQFLVEQLTSDAFVGKAPALGKG